MESKAVTLIKNTKNKDLVGKAKNTIKKTGEYVESNPKQTLYVVLGVVGLVLGYKIYKSASKGIDRVFNGDSDIDNQVDDVGGNTSNATISNQAANNYAQQLLDAMNVKRPIYGTDTDTIDLVFDRLMNGDDYMKVYLAFGKKDYNGYNSPPEGFWSNFDSYEKRDLNYWLQSELSSFFEPTLYNKVRTRVESTGVFVF
ncbi:hypothetical protein ACKGJY_14495 [Hyunsoonleella sp. 2307UL5-6]|uniref:hypothetical protein n=1 Tax=Hyunsoonleella sp. 2307UL5-6 TaxID=3384768 RepID=UPI0039BCA7F1